MFKIILAALLAAIAVFAWEALSWTVLGWHENGFRTFRNEDAVAEVIKANVTSGHGIYLLPAMTEPSAVATEEEKKAHMKRQQDALETGPYVHAIIRPGRGEVSMGMNMTLSFVRSFVCALLVAGLMSHVVAAYMARIGFAAAMGLFAGLTSDLPMWIWFENPGRDTMVNIADHMIAWIIGGAILGLFVGREPTAADVGRR